MKQEGPKLIDGPGARSKGKSSSWTEIKVGSGGGTGAVSHGAL